MNEEAINLDNCAREPIHVPGTIQPYGVLFVLREPELTVAQVSENVREFLGIEAKEMLDQPLGSFFTPDQERRVRFALDSVDPRENNPVELQLENKNGAGALDGFVHRNDGFSFLELEPASLAYSARFLEFYKLISRLTSKMHTAANLIELLTEAARGIRTMSGFDRVMIYRFAENYEGEVVAEDKAEGVEPYLGLWFPASDIPEQARRLYTLNPVRAIVDASYTPAALVPVLNPDTRRPTDLSFAGLRSVSPIHCEYLRNMGVAASMSVSILREGRLWGLVACHHFTPRMIPFELRKACTFVGDVLSGEITRREVEEESQYHSLATSIQAKFLELMSGAPDPLNGLVNASPNLLDYIPCDGAALIEGDRAQILGSAPGYDEVMSLMEMLRHEDIPSVFATNSLKNHFPLTEKLRHTASGLLALRIGEKPQTHILFFRPEVAETVRWGGNPEKPVTLADDGFRLSPRKSFAVWKEDVRARALPWTKAEIRAAGELRNLIAVVVYSRRTAT